MEKFIVVGAGLSGATIARLLAEDGNDVTVFDKRATLGGNAYDYVDKNGITVQPYGPHIFHTDYKEVYDFLSGFTEWREYKHRVLANVRGRLLPLPFNLASLEKCFPAARAERIAKVLKEEIGEGNSVSILELKKHNNPEIRGFAEFVYKNIYFKYTQKQWGLAPEVLGDPVLGRVPVTVSYEDGYFSDKYQVMPADGFSAMVNNVLRHPRIKLKLKTDAKKVLSLSGGEIFYKGTAFRGALVYTGRIEELFDYKFGALPYRTLKFRIRTKRRASYQPAAVINYTAAKPFTRVSEFTKFACDPCENTVIMREYPKKCGTKDMPYYPVPTPENFALYGKYAAEAKNYKNLYLLGRLACYEYINMDEAVKRALELYGTMEF